MVQDKPIVIVQSVLKADRFIIPGIRHYDHLMIDILHTLDERQTRFSPTKIIMGYVDQHGQFYTEHEAVALTKQNGQLHPDTVVNEKLSHHLWHQLSGRRVVCSAVRYKEYVFTSPRHFDTVHSNWFNSLPEDGYWRSFPKEQIEMGFVDQDGLFMDGTEALMVALRAKQIGIDNRNGPVNTLTSQDLY